MSVDIWSDYIIPSTIILLANLLSGPQGSLSWERVTAIFGWLACFSITAVFLLAWFIQDTKFYHYLLQVACFSLVTALARDYEKILKPIFDLFIAKNDRS